MDIGNTLNIAKQIIADARAQLVSIGRHDLQVVKKADNSFVTRADKETEQLIRNKLSKAFPDHNIFGEEFPSVDNKSAYTWVIDPIDGTHSFKHGIPLYGTMLCLLEQDTPVVSIIDLPGIDRSYAAAKGLGTTCNGSQVQLYDLQKSESVADEVIATGERMQFVKGGTVDVFDKLMQSHDHVRTYCDCFGHCLAAEGSVGAMVDFDIRLWDCMASVLIIEEAGGKAVCVGKRPDGEHLRYDWVFVNPRVVDWVCEHLDLHVT